jgi:two-component system response regulator
MPTEAPSVPAEILVLASSDAEVRLIQKAAGTDRLNVVGECPDVLLFLNREDRYSRAPRPDLILLDLDLSNESDCATLTQIKSHLEWKRIPVIVLASSATYAQVEQAYDLHANAYLVKPENEEKFVAMIGTTLHFWLKLARLPRG